MYHSNTHYAGVSGIWKQPNSLLSLNLTEKKSYRLSKIFSYIDAKILIDVK